MINYSDSVSDLTKYHLIKSVNLVTVNPDHDMLLLSAVTRDEEKSNFPPVGKFSFLFFFALI